MSHKKARSAGQARRRARRTGRVVEVRNINLDEEEYVMRQGRIADGAGIGGLKVTGGEWALGPPARSRKVTSKPKGWDETHATGKRSGAVRVRSK